MWPKRYANVSVYGAHSSEWMISSFFVADKNNEYSNWATACDSMKFIYSMYDIQNYLWYLIWDCVGWNDFGFFFLLCFFLYYLPQNCYKMWYIPLKVLTVCARTCVYTWWERWREREKLRYAKKEREMRSLYCTMNGQ